MKIIKAIFWNTAQNRLRLPWRFVLAMILMSIILFTAQIVVSIPIAAAAWTQIQAAEPSEINQIIRDQIEASPLLLQAVTLAAFLSVILTVWLVGRFLDRRRFADFGFNFSRNWWADFGFGLATGAIILTIAFLILLGAGWVTITGTFQPAHPGGSFIVDFLLATIVFIYVGIQEELLFRGYLMKNISEGISYRKVSRHVGIILSWATVSLLFGLAHLGNPGATWVSTVNIVLAGLLLGLGYVLTGELAIPIGIHITWNLFQGHVFGFPVSGTGNGLPTVIAIKQGGPDLWTGGAFGPEAGLVAIIAMLIGCGLTVLWVRWRYNQVGIVEAIAEPPERVEPEKLAGAAASSQA